jgi:hypothetical protein
MIIFLIQISNLLVELKYGMLKFCTLESNKDTNLIMAVQSFKMYEHIFCKV